MAGKFNLEMIHEEIVNFGEGGSLTGIFTFGKAGKTNNKTCTIFLNAGLIHKIGPNRLYKKLSENYCENGFNTFRFDFSGIGDSEYSNKKMSNEEAHFTEIVMAMDWIQKNKGIDKFLLSAICSGARLAFLASLEDSRVVGLSLIDGIYTDDNLLRQISRKANQNTTIRYYKKNAFSLKRWAKLLSGKSKLVNFRNIVIGVRRKVQSVFKKTVGNGLKKKAVMHQTTPSNPPRIKPWQTLVSRGVKIQLIFCEGGTAIDIFNLTLAKQLSKYKKTGELQNVLIKDVDHTFTPIWSQNHLLDLTSSWLKKEFKEDVTVSNTSLNVA